VGYVDGGSFIVGSLWKILLFGKSKFLSAVRNNRKQYGEVLYGSVWSRTLEYDLFYYGT
jgi:hypothetical protein